MIPEVSFIMLFRVCSIYSVFECYPVWHVLGHSTGDF